MIFFSFLFQDFADVVVASINKSSIREEGGAEFFFGFGGDLVTGDHRARSQVYGQQSGERQESIGRTNPAIPAVNNK